MRLFAVGGREFAEGKNEIRQTGFLRIKVGGWRSKRRGQALNKRKMWLMNATFVLIHARACDRLI